MTTVDRLIAQPLATKVRGEGGGSFQQVIHPYPGKTAKGYFEAARPIDADRVWILDMPVPPLAEYFRCKFPVAGEPVSLSQCHHMLVTIQFPDDFGVPNLRKIEVVDFEPRFARCSLVVHPVAVPIYLITVIQIFISQQVKTMTADLLCPLDDLFCLLRKPVPQQ